MSEGIFNQKSAGDSVESILNELDRPRKFREWARHFRTDDKHKNWNPIFFLQI